MGNKKEGYHWCLITFGVLNSTHNPLGSSCGYIGRKYNLFQIVINAVLFFQMATKSLGCTYTVWGFNFIIETTIGISLGPGVGI